MPTKLGLTIDRVLAFVPYTRKALHSLETHTLTDPDKVY